MAATRDPAPPPQTPNDICWIAASPSFGWFHEERGRRERILQGIASGLETRRSEIIATAAEETALTPDELAPEFLRMVRTFLMFAQLLREGSWVRAAIDRRTSDPQHAIGPNHDLRRMLTPVGGVAVFGASNFPLSYGVCGGDTASALAAGCTVVVKEHPAHPRLGRLLHSIAQEAIVAEGAPRGWHFVLGYIHNEDHNDHSVAQLLVGHQAIQAVGFTGSQGGGNAIVKLANQREQPIPVFAEMGSANTVYITAKAAQRRGAAIGEQLADAILARVGQQCTKPGLIHVQHLEAATALIDALVRRFNNAPARDMLAPWIAKAYRNRLDECGAAKGIKVIARGSQGLGPRSGEAVLMQASYADWSHDFTLTKEIFGPAAILIDVDEDYKLRHLPGFTERSLASSWYIEDDDGDLREHAQWSHGHWFQSTGRITFNSPPTGVRVCHSMVHGGPFPATNRPDTTAVGPFAIERWCRPVCYQNAPQDLLPDELKDANPLNIARFEDGQWVPGRTAS